MTVDLRAAAEEYARSRWPAAPFEVRSPATGERVGQAPDCGAAEAERAVAAAGAGFAGWSRAGAVDRSTVLRRWFDLVNQHREALARLITHEVGKPIIQARGEVDYAAAFISCNAEEILRTGGEFLVSADPAQRLMVRPQPVGPVLGITPWNFPAAMVTRTVAPALAAGCPVVLKPAEQSPLTALALAYLWHRAGGPDEVLQVLPCRDPAPVAGVALRDARIRKLTFTGSQAVGKLLYRQCADTIKGLSLELGGHAPFLVFEDADVDAAVHEALRSKFRYQGQTCVCANRIYVHESVAPAFRDAYVRRVAALRVGDPFDEATDVGPLIDADGLSKVVRHVEDARARGASVLVGGQALGGLYYAPTVLTGVAPDMAVLREETFGPVAPLATFHTEEEAVRLANDSPVGLAAYYWTRDVGRVFRLADRIEAGIIGANEGIPGGSAHVPFGGVKESGLGRAGGRWGLAEYLEPRYVALRLPAERSGGD